MKHLIKTTLLLFAVLLVNSVCVSCVESEQEPDFGGTDVDTTDNIDVKMPAPGSISLFMGGKVLLKGSGFSARDEVYVQRRTYNNDDYDNDYSRSYIAAGEKIQAVVTGFTSTELTFLIPSEVFGDENYGEAYVFFKRDGSEYKLGYMYVEPFPVYLAIGEYTTRGSSVALQSDYPGVTFTSGDKVYLQNFRDANGNIPDTADKLQAEVTEVTSNQLLFTAPFGLKEDVTYLIFLEQDGVEYRLDTYLTVRPIDVNIEALSRGEVLLRTYNSFSFLEGDRICLQRMGGTDNQGYPIGYGEKITAEVKSVGASDLVFKIPSGIVGEFIIILIRNGVECNLNQIFSISESDTKDF